MGKITNIRWILLGLAYFGFILELTSLIEHTIISFWIISTLFVSVMFLGFWDNPLFKSEKIQKGDK